MYRLRSFLLFTTEPTTELVRRWGYAMYDFEIIIENKMYRIWVKANLELFKLEVSQYIKSFKAFEETLPSLDELLDTINDNGFVDIKSSMMLDDHSKEFIL